MLGIEKTRTCPYNPKSDCLVERANKSIPQMLKVFVSQEQTEWGGHLCYVVAVYRATRHRSTGCSQNLLMLGREVDCHVDLMVGPPPYSPEKECPVEYVE